MKSRIQFHIKSTSFITILLICTEYDTDEETDELLDKQYQKRDKSVDIPELEKEQRGKSAETSAQVMD